MSDLKIRQEPRRGYAGNGKMVHYLWRSLWSSTETWCGRWPTRETDDPLTCKTCKRLAKKLPVINAWNESVEEA